MRYTIEKIRLMPEGQTFDCKSILIEPKALANTIVAMANADGGMIAVGISDKTRRIEGIDQDKAHLNEILRTPFDFCVPTISVTTEFMPCQDSEGNDDRIVFETPGKLPGIVRTDNIRHTHFSRNPKIAEYLKAYDYVKEFGEGVDRMCRELSAIGTKEPQYHLVAFIMKASVWANVLEEGQEKARSTERHHKTHRSCQWWVLESRKFNIELQLWLLAHCFSLIFYNFHSVVATVI